jgi:hypothetical protein
MRLWPALLVVCLLCSCERHHIVLDASQVLGTVDAPSPTHLIVRCSLDEEATDPLPIDGTDDAFADVRKTLEDVARSALAKWSMGSTREGGWELKLNLHHAKAGVSGGRAHVELAVRATLTSGVGRVYADQTRAFCSEDADDPNAAIDACMRTLAHDLEHWIQGVNP